MKASDSTDYVDPTYVTNRAQAKLQGLKVGAYHFARPDATAGDAVAEADHFIATADWGGGDLVPVLDLETTGGLSVAKLQAWVSAFLGRINDRTGVKAMIYTSPSFWTNKMGDTQAFAAAGYKSLWVAHWTTNPSATVPASNWAGNGWTFWQYTSDGSVPGHPRARRPRPLQPRGLRARPAQVAGGCASPRLLATWKPAGPPHPPTRMSPRAPGPTRSSTSSGRR